jgi:hypothetical protein
MEAVNNTESFPWRGKCGVRKHVSVTTYGVVTWSKTHRNKETNLAARLLALWFRIREARAQICSPCRT